MIYVIKTDQYATVAVLRSWGGRVTDTRSVSGHWLWCTGRDVKGLLAWVKTQGLRWYVSADENEWDTRAQEIATLRAWEQAKKTRSRVKPP